MLGNRKFPTALSFSCPHSRPRSISWSLDYTTFSLSDVTRVSFLLYIHPRNAGHFLFDIDNRVEIQKLNQVAAELPPGWVFGVQLGLGRYMRSLRSKRISKGRPRRIIIWYQILSFFAAEMLEKTQISHIFWLRASRRVLRSVFDVPSFNLFAAEILIYPLQPFYGGNLIVSTLNIYRWC